MFKSTKSVHRAGRIYRFSINDIDYAAFIWQMGVQFRGRVEGHPEITQTTGRTALAVRDELQKLIVAQENTAD
ncbi:hypothetical protein F8S13_25420 [Chloroflexia bacterium SDU3-3]|nr:hypothetical protein F8S13_25420 [Chloroflexia bacterium SDU3-3]